MRSADDPEAGLPPAAALTGRIGDAARKLGASVKDTAQGAANRHAGLHGHACVVRARLRSPCSVPSANSLQYALFFFAAGGLLLMLAFFVALPVIVLSPTKFAIRRARTAALLVAHC